jgi:hypothetical protein
MKRNGGRAIGLWGGSRSNHRGHLIEHELFRKPVPTFRDHAFILFTIEQGANPFPQFLERERFADHLDPWV